MPRNAVHEGCGRGYGWGQYWLTPNDFHVNPDDERTGERCDALSSCLDGTVFFHGTRAVSPLGELSSSYSGMSRHSSREGCGGGKYKNIFPQTLREECGDTFLGWVTEPWGAETLRRAARAVESVKVGSRTARTDEAVSYWAGRKGGVASSRMGGGGDSNAQK